MHERMEEKKAFLSSMILMMFSMAAIIEFLDISEKLYGRNGFGTWRVNAR